MFIDHSTEPFELTPDEYDIAEPITDISYNAVINNLNGNQWAGIMVIPELGQTLHIMRIGFEPAESIGIRACYRNGDETRYSQTMWVNVKTKKVTYEDAATSVAQPIAAEVTNVRYYDMMGREVSAQAKGLVVKKVTRADGTEQTSKYIRK